MGNPELSSQDTGLKAPETGYNAKEALYNVGRLASLAAVLGMGATGIEAATTKANPETAQDRIQKQMVLELTTEATFVGTFLTEAQIKELKDANHPIPFGEIYLVDQCMNNDLGRELKAGLTTDKRATYDGEFQNFANLVKKVAAETGVDPKPWISEGEKYANGLEATGAIEYTDASNHEVTVPFLGTKGEQASALDLTTDITQEAMDMPIDAKTSKLVKLLIGFMNRAAALVATEKGMRIGK